MKPLHVAIEVSKDEHYKSPLLKSIRDNWPSMAKDYRHYCHVYHPEQGDVWVWTSPEGQKFIHFVMEDSDNNPMRSEQRFHYYKLGLKKLVKLLKTDELEKVVMPKGSFKFSKDEMPEAIQMFQEAFQNNGHKVQVELEA